MYFDVLRFLILLNVVFKFVHLVVCGSLTAGTVNDFKIFAVNAVDNIKIVNQ